jgi:hypothetical protein
VDRYAVLSDRAFDNVGHAVVVEADTAQEAAEKGQELFERELPADFVCGHCDQPFPLEVHVVTLESHQVFKGRRYVAGEMQRA